MSGVAMEVSGSSRPASGGEHLISHVYDQLASEPSMHGLQVGIASLGTMWLQSNPNRETVLQVLTETGFASYIADHRLDRETFVKAIGLAPSLRPGYYTALSQPGAIQHLQEYVAGDPFRDAYLA